MNPLPLLIIIHSGSIFIFQLLFGGFKFVVQTYGPNRRCSEIQVNKIQSETALPYGSGTSIVNATHSSIHFRIFLSIYEIQFPTAVSHRDICRCICNTKEIKVDADNRRVKCVSHVSRLLSADAVPTFSSVTEKYFGSSDALEASTATTIDTRAPSVTINPVEIKLVINDQEFMFSFDLSAFSEDEVANAFCRDKADFFGLSGDQLSLCVPPIATALRRELASLKEDFEDETSQLVPTSTPPLSASQTNSKSNSKPPIEDPFVSSTSTLPTVVRIQKNINGVEYVFDFHRNSTAVPTMAKQFCEQERTTLMLTETAHMRQCLAVIEQMLRQELSSRLSVDEMSAAVAVDGSAVSGPRGNSGF